MTSNEWIELNYENIIEWSKNIAKGDQLAEDLAHYAIWQMLEHPKREALAMRERDFPNTMKAFMLTIIRNSWIGPKSPFSRTEKLHRADIGMIKRTIHSDAFWDSLELTNEEEYDHHQDVLIEAVQDILNQMDSNEGKLWYNARLFKMWIECKNFSELSRITSIPRTSISKAVEEAKQYIKDELNNRNLLP